MRVSHVSSFPPSLAIGINELSRSTQHFPILLFALEIMTSEPIVYPRVEYVIFDLDGILIQWDPWAVMLNHRTRSND